MSGKKRKSQKQQGQGPKKQKKQNTQQDNSDETEPSSSRNDMVIPTVARVSMNKVKSTWPLLSDVGQNEVMSLLENASMPILQAIPGDKKRVEFQELLKPVLNQAQRKLKRIPVPPTTRDTFYKHDTLVNQREQLELALLPLLDQVSMLEQEITSEKKNIERDRTYLEKLKRDTKDHKGAFTNATSLAQQFLSKHDEDDDDDDNLDDKPEDIGLNPDSSPSSQTQAIDGSAEFNPMLSKLQSHLTKIDENTSGVESLVSICQRLESALTGG